MKRPWMPLYVGDYLAKTGHLTTLQHGAYMLLLMHYWVNGKLPTDETQLQAIARMTPEQWLSNSLAIASFFTRDWRHSRMEEELEKVKNISRKRAMFGQRGGLSKRRAID